MKSCLIFLKTIMLNRCQLNTRPCDKRLICTGGTWKFHFVTCLQSEAITETLDIVNVVFTTIFTLEATVKIIGLRWHYFRRIWNVFDLIIVILSIIGNCVKNTLTVLSSSVRCQGYKSWDFLTFNAVLIVEVKQCMLTSLKKIFFQLRHHSTQKKSRRKICTHHQLEPLTS